MITDAGELGYPTPDDVRDEVLLIRENVAQVRNRVEAEHEHFLSMEDDSSITPPKEVRS